MSMKMELAVDHLTMLDVSPPDMVEAASEAGFDSVGLRVSAATPEEEPWPMSPGSSMLDETLRLMEDTGIRVLDVEVVRLRPDTKREDYKGVLEAGARLGARYVTVNGDDPDIERASETFAALVEDAKPYGLRPLIEAIPYTEVSSFEDSVRIAERSDGGGILFDALHFRRFGGDIERLRGLDPSLIGYAQLCDGPLAAPESLPRPSALPRGLSTEGTDLQFESRAMRLLPGDGELPLAEFMAALPSNLPISIEAPVLSLRASLTPVEFLRRARRSVEGVFSSEVGWRLD
ncbi:MAG: sugar phosphate isomerase/epimerase [Rubrobacter sp.]|nr:sugar phosphate isomerase/epimerase [Rubrobacter sp.]